MAKKALATPFGLCEFCRMPFGLRNAVQTFQRFTDMVPRGLDFAFDYVDDILISIQPQYRATSCTLSSTLSASVWPRPVHQPGEMCIWIGTSQIFESHHQCWGYPPTHGPRWSCSLIPNPRWQEVFALVRWTCLLLTAALTYTVQQFWHNCTTPQELRVTHEVHSVNNPLMKPIKPCQTDAVMLAHPQPYVETSLTTDASKFAVGTVLEQFTAGQWTPASLFSKKLNSTECNYSAFDRELLAVYFAVRHFHGFSHQHGPQAPNICLEVYFRTSRPTLGIFIPELTRYIRPIKGASNQVAVALYTQSLVVLEALTSAQSNAKELHQFTLATISMKLEYVPIPNFSHTLLCDVSQGRSRPIVPSTMRRDIFNKIHSLSHPGIKASRHLLAQRYIWPNKKHDVANWTHTCHDCQKSEVQRHVKAQLQPFPHSDKRFGSIHVDIAGPLPPS